jgi:transketolase
MRTAFIEALLEAAEHDPRVWLVCGDLGYSVLEPFADRFPERYLNAGVSEQNMTGVAAGLALSGNIVFTYSIANFPTLRPLEQIRNDVCYHRANVKIVSVGGGLSYGGQGYTHHGMMRLLPEMTVIAPGDPREARAAVHALIALDGPGYLRLGKAGEPLVHEHPIRFEIGRAIEIRPGADVAVLAIGSVVAMAADVVREAAASGIDCRLLSVHTLAPLDREAVVRAARETGGLVIVEEHGPGALATCVSEVLAEEGIAVPFERVGLPKRALRVAGSQYYLREQGGLSAAAVLASIRAVAARAVRTV